MLGSREIQGSIQKEEINLSSLASNSKRSSFSDNDATPPIVTEASEDGNGK